MDTMEPKEFPEAQIKLKTKGNRSLTSSTEGKGVTTTETWVRCLEANQA